MYGNSFQNGFFFQVWDSRVNPEKNPIYKQLFRKSPSSLKNQFDKQVKSFIYQLSAQSKICLPSDDQKLLSLHQRYLVVQLQIPLGAQWSMQIGITDLNTQKKRINLTTTPGKQQIKYFSLRYPLEQSPIQKGVWSFLAIDIYSFCKAFKGTIFRSLDHILINGNCKLRRIFTMKEWVEWQIPKNYWLPSQIQQTLQLIEYKQALQLNLINSSLSVNQSSTSVQNQYGKLAESKISQTPHNFQKLVKYNRNNNQNNYPGSLKLNKQRQKYGNYQQSQNIFKLPQVQGLTNSNKLKDSGVLKSSKLSSKIQEAISSQFGLLAKSNRSLTKGDLIIQKSKIRLNSLQQKEQQILTRMKSQQSKLNQYQKIQNKKSRILNTQLFQISQNKQQYQKKKSKNALKSYDQIESNSPSNNNINIGANKLKIQKHFEEDKIYDQNLQQQQQSSYQSSSYRKQNIETPQHYFKNIPDQATLIKNSSNSNQGNINKTINKNTESRHQKILKEKEQIRIVNKKNQQREQIIEQDLWSDNEEQRQTHLNPIQQMIVGQPKKKQALIVNSKIAHIKGSKGIGKTVISKENNKQIIVHSIQGDPQAKDPNGRQLQLIYDQMVGCYYHPSTNTYYEVANQ